MMCCPTCGHELDDGGVPVESLLDINLTPTESLILEALIRAYPRTVRSSWLIEYLWSDDPNGGPDGPLRCIYTHVHRIRRALEKHGWTIPILHGGHGVYGAYRLRRMP